MERFELVEREVAAAYPLAVLERVDGGPTGELHLARTEAEELHRLAEAHAYGLAVERLQQTPGDGGADDPAAEGGHRFERVDAHDDVLETTLGEAPVAQKRVHPVERGDARVPERRGVLHHRELLLATLDVRLVPEVPGDRGLSLALETRRGPVRSGVHPCVRRHTVVAARDRERGEAAPGRQAQVPRV